MSEVAHTFGVRPSGGAWVGVERVDGRDELLTARHRSPAAARRDLRRVLRGYQRDGLIAKVPRALPALD